MVNVLCMKWGTRYGAEYVNHLANGVRRHLSLPHRFVCFTEDPTGIQKDVEVRPLPVEFPRGAGPERYWNKLGIFADPLADIQGRVLCLDLDVVLVGSIDCFFTHPGPCFIIKEFSKRAGPKEGNMSVCGFDAGALGHVLENYRRDPAAVQASYWFDQHYVSAQVPGLDFWPESWCRSFKKHCVAPAPRCYFETPRIPEDARIVVFHGHPNPPDAIRGCRIRHSLRVARSTPWVQANWS